MSEFKWMTFKYPFEGWKSANSGIDAATSAIAQGQANASTRKCHVLELPSLKALAEVSIQAY